MPANPLSDDIAGLLRVFEEFERSIGERRMSTDR
jgi:hypothetical protein